LRSATWLKCHFGQSWRAAANIAQPVDPWRLPLERLRGRVGDDGVERVATQIIFDVLNVPQRGRGAGACRRGPLLVAPDIALVLPRTFDLKRAITVSRPILAIDTSQPGHETMS
jgi:hypothetical protein